MTRNFHFLALEVASDRIFKVTVPANGYDEAFRLAEEKGRLECHGRTVQIQRQIGGDNGEHLSREQKQRVDDWMHRQSALAATRQPKSVTA